MSGTYNSYADFFNFGKEELFSDLYFILLNSEDYKWEFVLGFKWLDKSYNLELLVEVFLVSSKLILEWSLLLLSDLTLLFYENWILYYY